MTFPLGDSLLENLFTSLSNFFQKFENRIHEFA